VPAYKLEELKFTELEIFDRARTLFIISVSPLEEHGPHLPIGVDLFNAEFFADQITRRFLEKYSDWNVVRMPSFPIGSFAFDAPGTLIVRPKIIRELVIDTLSSYAKYGFKQFLISNAHGGPTHIVALEEAARVLSKRYGARVLSFTGHIAWEFLRGKYWPQIRERLSLTTEEAEALKDDAHGGQWETSMMLKLRPDLVDKEFKNLKPFAVKLIEKLRPNYALKMEGGKGYVGHPEKANLELANVSSEFLIERVFEMVENHIFSEEAPPPSMFYRFPLFRVGFLPAIIAIGILVIILFLLFK
jgi:creatinine amidohydrolase